MNLDQLNLVYIITIVLIIGWAVFVLWLFLPHQRAERRAFKIFQKARRSGRRKHLIVEGEKDPYICICGKKFSSLKRAEDHIRVESWLRTINRSSE